MKLITAETAYL